MAKFWRRPKRLKTVTFVTIWPDGRQQRHTLKLADELVMTQGFRFQHDFAEVQGEVKYRIWVEDING